MATVEELLALRRMAAEPTTDTYTDDALSALIAAEGSLDGAAAVVWREKAAKAATLVDTSESGSSRKMQQVHTNALKMAEFYASASTAPSPVVETNAPFTVGIERV